MKTLFEIQVLSDFADDYGVETLLDLKKLDNVDIMENVLDIANSLSKLDTCDSDKAMKKIDKLNKWKLLYNYINEKI